MTTLTTHPRHFIDLWRFDAQTLRAILDDAKARKAAREGWPKGRVDAAILVDLTNPQGAWDRLVGMMPPERVLPLPLLDLTRAASSERPEA